MCCVFVCYFVIGTHQIPLFEGLPPEEMTSSPDPMSWLTAKLKAQYTIERQHTQNESLFQSLFCTPVFGGSGHSNAVSPSSVGSQDSGDDLKIPNNSNSSLTKRRPSRPMSEAHLTHGSSAIIRVIDSRLQPLDSQPLHKEHTKHIDETIMNSILKAASSYTVESLNGKSHLVDTKKFQTLHHQFQYYALKDAAERTVKDAISENINAKVLVEEVNLKFGQSMFN